MKTHVLIEQRADGTFCAYAPNLNNTISGYGSSVTKAIKDFENAFDETIQVFQDLHKPIPDELLNVEFEYITRQPTIASPPSALSYLRDGF